MISFLYALLITIAGVLYAASFSVSVIRAMSGSKIKSGGKLASGLVIAGFVIHSFAQIIPIFSEGRAPIETPFEVLESAAWFFVAFELLWKLFFQVRFLGVFSMLPAAIMTGLPSFCPTFWAGDTAAKTGNALIAAHAAFAAASLALTFLAAAFAPMYLLQNRALSQKCHWGFAPKLPSVDTLIKCLKIALAMAASLMGISIALGATAVTDGNLSTLMGVKFILATILFFAQSALAASLWRGCISPIIAAKLSIALFVFAILTLAPILAGSFF